MTCSNLDSIYYINFWGKIFGTKWDSLEQNCKKYIFETIWESQTWNEYEIFEGIIVTCNNDKEIPLKIPSLLKINKIQHLGFALKYINEKGIGLYEIRIALFQLLKLGVFYLFHKRLKSHKHQHFIFWLEKWTKGLICMWMSSGIENFFLLSRVL